MPATVSCDKPEWARELLLKRFALHFQLYRQVVKSVTFPRRNFDRIFAHAAGQDIPGLQLAIQQDLTRRAFAEHAYLSWEKMNCASVFDLEGKSVGAHLHLSDLRLNELLGRLTENGMPIFVSKRIPSAFHCRRAAALRQRCEKISLSRPLIVWCPHNVSLVPGSMARSFG